MLDNFSDMHLSIAAATVEVGFSAVVAAATLLWKSMRSRTVVILGALTPCIFVLLGVAYAQFIAPEPGSMAGAGWVMGFAAYIAALVGGVLLSLVPLPTNLYVRYLLGLASVPISIGLVSLL